MKRRRQKGIGGKISKRTRRSAEREKFANLSNGRDVVETLGQRTAAPESDNFSKLPSFRKPATVRVRRSATDRRYKRKNGKKKRKKKTKKGRGRKQKGNKRTGKKKGKKLHKTKPQKMPPKEQMTPKMSAETDEDILKEEEEFRKLEKSLNKPSANKRLGPKRSKKKKMRTESKKNEKLKPQKMPHKDILKEDEEFLKLEKSLKKPSAKKKLGPKRAKKKKIRPLESKKAKKLDRQKPQKVPHKEREMPKVSAKTETYFERREEIA